MTRKLTEGEQRELDEKLLDEQRKLAAEVLDEHFTLGGDKAEEEEREYEADRREKREELPPPSRAEFEALKAKLAANADLAEKALKANKSFDSVIAAEKDDRLRRERYALYGAIRAGGGKVRIQLHTSDEPGGTRDVDVSINGRHYSVPRGVPVEVPLEVMSVLDDARVRHYRPEMLPDGSVRQTAYDFLRFPYTRLDGPNVLGG